jgi:hypothetical protein
MATQIRRLAMVTVMLGFGVGGPAEAGSVLTTRATIHVGRTAKVTIQPTRNFVDYGPPINLGTVKACVKTPFDLPRGATDYRPIVTLNTGTTATDYIGAILPDPTNPGHVFLPDLANYLYAKIGLNEVDFPDLANSSVNVFISIDLEKWINGGGVAPPFETVETFNNGTSASLPGIQVGLSPFTFDPNVGFVNSDPFTGDVFELGIQSVQAQMVPEPSSFILLVVGVLCLLLGRVAGAKPKACPDPPDEG